MQLKKNVAVVLLFCRLSCYCWKEMGWKEREKAYLTSPQKPIKAPAHLSKETPKASNVCLCVCTLLGLNSRCRKTIEKRTCFSCTQDFFCWRGTLKILRSDMPDEAEDLCWPPAEQEGGLEWRRREMRSGREGSEGRDRNRSWKSKTHLLNEGERGRKTEQENRLVDWTWRDVCSAWRIGRRKDEVPNIRSSAALVPPAG